jgi:hypothetical protein
MHEQREQEPLYRLFFKETRRWDFKFRLFKKIVRKHVGEELFQKITDEFSRRMNNKQTTADLLNEIFELKGEIENGKN